MWKQLKQLFWQWRGVWIAAPSIASVVILLRLTGLLQTLEWVMLDQYTQMRPLEPQDPRVVIVGITESDVQKYGTPLSDQILATLLQRLKQQNPRGIGLDLYRDQPVGKGYAALKQVFESTPNLIGIEKLGGLDPEGAVAPPPILKKLGQVTANDVVFDADGKLRRGLLYLENRQGENMPTLGMAMALLYLESEQIAPAITEEGYIRLGETVLPPLEPNYGAYVRAQTQGYQTMLNYRGPRNSFQVVSVEQVLTGKIPSDFGRDRIILIGPVAESLKDFFPTPYSMQFMQLPNPSTGVEIHANLISQVISSVLEQRPTLKAGSDLQDGLWIGAWAMVGAVLVWQQRYGRRAAVAAQLGAKSGGVASSPKAGVWQSLRIVLSLNVAGGVLMASTYGAFLMGWWLPVVPALLGLSGAAIVVTAYLAQTAAEMRKTLGRYLTDAVVASLLETPKGLTLVGERRTVTTLISDIRGFTSLSEQVAPEQVVNLLNLYLKEMTQVIQQYGGTLNDIMGDGLVVFFGAPLARPDDAERAVACAVAMQLAMESVNHQSQAVGLPNLEMGIGINTGDVVVGNIGSENHTKYTAIGNHVNIAARIESFTVGGQILISESTFEFVRSMVRIDGQTQSYMKGLAMPISLYEVSGIAGDHNIFLPEDHDAFVTLKQELPILYGMVQNKQVEDLEFEGMLVKLSAKGAEVRSSYLPPVLSTLKLTLVLHPAAQPARDGRPYAGESDGEEPEYLGEIYGRVMAKRVLEETGFFVRFTSLPPRASEYLQSIRSDRRIRRGS
jgi:adenylate cyclase